MIIYFLANIKYINRNIYWLIWFAGQIIWFVGKVVSYKLTKLFFLNKANM